MNQTETPKPVITSIPYNDRAQAHQDGLGLIGKPTLPGSPTSQPEANSGQSTPSPIQQFNTQGVPDGKGGVWMCGPTPKVAPLVQMVPNNQPIPTAGPDMVRILQDSKNLKHYLDEAIASLQAVTDSFITQERVNAIGYLKTSAGWLNQDINKLSAKIPQV